MKDALGMTLAVMAGLVVIVGLSWFFLVSGRPMAKFSEETRRQVYQESVTAQTACRAELTRLYREWSKSEGPHKRALESLAVAESDRIRCADLPHDVYTWVEGLK